MKNILVIGDLHCPFDLDNYLNFCKRVYKDYKCNHVVFIGDIIDSHSVSDHDPDPDGFSPGHELEEATKRLARWYKAFPKADVISGNHDRRVKKRIFKSGVPSKWVKSFAEVLETPNWNYHDSLILDEVLYIHGEAGTARNTAIKEMMSTVQGHRHTEAYVFNLTGRNRSLFGVQVGCGIDSDSYAMAYAKAYAQPALACAVVLNNGKMPILIKYGN